MFFSIVNEIRRKLQSIAEDEVPDHLPPHAPYARISFPEYSGRLRKRSEAYTAVEAYLSDMYSTQAKKLRPDPPEDELSIVLTMEDDQELTDDFGSAELVWSKTKTPPSHDGDEVRSYVLKFHKSHRSMVNNVYLDHVMKKGIEIWKERQRKLFTNGSGENSSGSKWCPLVFQHPATFETLAMDPTRKKEIIDDLVSFSNPTAGTGKLGYLLFGPPGTGKTSMIAAIANFLNYDVYDVDLTEITDLQELLNQISSKSIVVFENIDHIDCSLNQGIEDADGAAEKNPIEKEALYGLLNVIDGLSSACGDQRIIIILTTTLQIERLDPALTHTMDKLIEMTYCGFEAFKILAKNYLGIEDHDLFDKIEGLLEEVEVTPADVTEILMGEVPTTCLRKLVDALEKVKDLKEKDVAKGKFRS